MEENENYSNSPLQVLILKGLGIASSLFIGLALLSIACFYTGSFAFSMYGFVDLDNVYLLSLLFICIVSCPLQLRTILLERGTPKSRAISAGSEGLFVTFFGVLTLLRYLDIEVIPYLVFGADGELYTLLCGIFIICSGLVLIILAAWEQVKKFIG